LACFMGQYALASGAIVRSPCARLTLFARYSLGSFIVFD
jgi:hypothetical protein